MNVLEMDVGNSRAKWRLTDSSATQASGAVQLPGANEKGFAGVFDQVAAELSVAGLQPDRVRVSSVRGRDAEIVMTAEISQRWQLTVEFARVSKACAGVTNSYREVSRMGVDRWLAMLAAYSQFSGGVCVVDAGSALTVDLVGQDGSHMGGYIAPGLEMMLQSMTGRSSALTLSEQPGWSGVEPGTDTSGAMRQGVLAMSSGWLNHLYTDTSGLQWVITGGDATVLMPQLCFDVVHCPVLVLDGLSLALP